LEIPDVADGSHGLSRGVEVDAPVEPGEGLGEAEDVKGVKLRDGVAFGEVVLWGVGVNFGW